MRGLENRLPPLLVMLLAALLMGLGAQQWPSLALPAAVRFGGGAILLLVGAGVCLAGVLAFRMAKTTVNPLRPESVSTLVRTGIYRHTRNPMYLGFAICLLAWSLVLASPFALLGIVAFVLYLNRFQIFPEERVLAGLFGEAFADYRAQVRRWL